MASCQLRILYFEFIFFSCILWPIVLSDQPLTARNEGSSVSGFQKMKGYYEHHIVQGQSKMGIRSVDPEIGVTTCFLNDDQNSCIRVVKGELGRIYHQTFNSSMEFRLIFNHHYVSTNQFNFEI